MLIFSPSLVGLLEVGLALHHQANPLSIACRVPWRRIGHCIIKLDSKAFQTADDVRAVLQCIPTEDESNMLQSYVKAGGELTGLSDAELFCLDLMKVS